MQQNSEFLEKSLIQKDVTDGNTENSLIFQELSQSYQQGLQDPKKNQQDQNNISSIEQQDDINDSASNFLDFMLQELSLNSEDNNGKLNAKINDNNGPFAEDEGDQTETFEFRQYQTELYEKGKGKNSIIYLETGTGKTLVIMMLMWHQLCTSSEKRVVFLGNTIQLVEQQARYLRNKLHRVAELLQVEIPENLTHQQYAKQIIRQIRVIHGNKFPDNWNKIRWRLLFQNSKVFFMTSQVFLNCLRKGIVRIDEFSFIGFDECHSTASNHSYNNIMREFYLDYKRNPVYKNKLPVIVGSTASPVVNSFSKEKEAVYKDLVQLCANLDSMYLHVEQDMVKKYLVEANIEYMEYKPILDKKLTFEYIEYKNQDLEIQIELYKLMKVNNFGLQFLNIKNYLIERLACCSKHSNNPFRRILKQLLDYIVHKGMLVIIELGQFSFYLMLEMIIQQTKLYIIKQRTQYQVELKQMLEFFQFQQAELNNVFKGDVLEGSTPKLKQLLLYLKEKVFNLQFNGQQTIDPNIVLIFVKLRVIAEYLQTAVFRFLKQNNIENKIQSAYLIGLSKKSKSAGLQDLKTQIIDDKDIDEQIDKIKQNVQKDHSQFTTENPDKDEEDQHQVLILTKKYIMSGQTNVLERFKKQEIQILISTSVAEEGLDIPSCNYVINFNTTVSSKSFVQMKGRARKLGSKFIIMMPQESNEEIKSQSQQQVQKLTQMGIKELSSQNDKLLKVIEMMQQKELKSAFYESYNIVESGALINTNWSQTLITNFCNLIPITNNRRAQPSYSIYEIIQTTAKIPKYLAFVLLPVSLKSIVFGGKICNTVDNAKSSAALNAAMALYQDGYLSQDLTPAYQAECGYHMGASEDDANIEQSDIYKKIMRVNSRYLLTQAKLGAVTLRSTQVYYRQENAKIFYHPGTENLCLITVQHYDRKFKLICDKYYCDYIYDQAENLKQFNIALLNSQSLNQVECDNLLKKYQEYIIDFFNLSKEDDTYSRLHDQGLYQLDNRCYSFILVDDLNESYQDKVEILYQALIQLTKTQTFVEVLQKKFQHLQFDIPIQNSLKVYNHLLQEFDKYLPQLSVKQYNLRKTAIDLSNLFPILPQCRRNQSPGLFQIIRQSINVDGYDRTQLLIGKKIYQFLVAIQVYIEHIYMDGQVLKNKSRKYFSTTHIKNNLLSETQIFTQLHCDQTDNNLLSYLPGLRLAYRSSDDIDLPVSDNQYSEFKNHFQNQFPYHTHFTTIQFANFFYHTIALLQDPNDNGFMETSKLVTAFGVLGGKHFKNSFQTVDAFLEINRSLYLSIQQTETQQYFSSLQNNIGYKFNRFPLLFQALTDTSFKLCIHQIIYPKYDQKFQIKNNNNIQINEHQLNGLTQQLQNMNNIPSISYSNEHLAFFGKALYSLICCNILLKIELCKKQHFYFENALQQLQLPSTIAFIATKLDLSYFINSQNIEAVGINQFIIQKQPGYKKLKRILDTKIHSDIGVKILCSSFLALIAAIYMDCGGDLQFMVSFCRNIIFERLKLDILISQDYIEKSMRFRFFKWYKKNIGDPYNFDLVKIPHQDYNQHRLHNLYIPYDNKKGVIGMIHKIKVNLLNDKFIEVTQLHIYAEDKVRAWNQLCVKFTTIDQ